MPRGYKSSQQFSSRSEWRHYAPSLDADGQRQPEPRAIFITGFEDKLSEYDVINTFMQFGKIVSEEIFFYSKVKGAKQRLTCRIEFEHDDAVPRAIAAINGQRGLEVIKAVKRKEIDLKVTDTLEVMEMELSLAAKADSVEGGGGGGKGSGDQDDDDNLTEEQRAKKRRRHALEEAQEQLRAKIQVMQKRLRK